MFGRKTKKKLHNHIDTLIGSKTHINGSLNFSGGLRVDGKINGDVVSSGNENCTLVLSDQGVIEGKIQVTNVIVNGVVTGPIHAKGYIELQPNARVFGDVHYGSMEIQLGASIEGRMIRQEVPMSEEPVRLIPTKKS